MGGAERKQKASLEPVMYKSLSPQKEAAGPEVGLPRIARKKEKVLFIE